ncbi:CBWD3 protein, partial [Emberiza fucata]|nr:CBWD3 protein [Emberiza fucata]
GPSALMEDEDCPDLVPIGAGGAELTDAGPDRKIPVTIITGYLGEQRERRSAGTACGQGRPGRAAAGPGLPGGRGPPPHGPGEQRGALRPLRSICRATLSRVYWKNLNFATVYILHFLGAVASMFWVDSELGSDIYLDGKYKLIFLCIAISGMDLEQVALADLIIINKTDLVSEEELNKVRMSVSFPFSSLFRVDLSNVLDLHAFDSLSGVSLQKKLEHVKTTHAHLDKAIITVTFEVPGNVKEEDLNLFIQNLLWEKNVKDKTGCTMDVIRLKGLVSVQGKSHQVIVQGVHELYDLEETSVAWKEDEKRTNRLVLIGRNLDKEIIKEVFIATVREEQGNS